MYLDAELEFSDSQAITVDALSTNIIDLSVAGAVSHDQLWVVIQCDTAFTNLATLDITLYTDSDTTVNDGIALWTQQFALAELTAGATLATFKLPTQIFDNATANAMVGLKRYLGVYYDVTGTTETTGAVSAFLTNSIDQANFKS